MLNIREIIVRYLRMTTAVMALLIIIFSIVLQVNREQQLNWISTQSIFLQVEHLLSENAKELDEIRMDYSRACLNNAETIAYIIQNTPKALDRVDELRHIARFTDVDEIHLFNTDGIIYNGTHPEYYHMSVDDGQQIGFFKQMLENKSIKLVQPITPNTAIGDFIQYSAVWSPNGEFFVQVGMKQENVLKVTKKNDLSYIFSLLKVNSSVDLYAVDKEKGMVVGATASENTGRMLDDIGIPLEKAISHPGGFHAWVNGKPAFCIFADCGTNYIGRIIPFNVMYRNVITITLMLAAGIIAIAVILVAAVTRFLNKEIIAGIESVNTSLTEISEGNLDARVNVCSCIEFSELSGYINDMITSLLSSTEKISYVLNKTDLQIGVYEYNEKMKTVRHTEKVAKILDCDAVEISRITADSMLFKEYLAAKIFDKVSEEENIYRLYDNGEKYVKHEEFIFGNSILGILMDVTGEYNRRRQLEMERDMDMLTGLYNRRGLEGRVNVLSACPDKLKHGALVMIDADGLKKINDQYGHDAGDAYLKGIGDAIRLFNSKDSICARWGGDEFVMFLYNFESDAQVDEQIQRLVQVRQNVKVAVSDSHMVNVNFSFGVSRLNRGQDFQTLLKEADEKMYESKRERKQCREAAK